MSDPHREEKLVEAAFDDEYKKHFAQFVQNLVYQPEKDAAGEYETGLVKIREAREVALGLTVKSTATAGT